MATRPAQWFDPESGQVYTEQTCKAGPSIPDWLWKTRGSAKQCKKFVNPGRGCSSLRAMSKRCIAVNASDLTATAMETLLLHLVRESWLEIARNDLDSFQVWKLFVELFGKKLDRRSLEHKKIFFKDSSVWMTEWINHIIPPSFDWVTFLTLSEINCSRTDLIQLSRLTNLGVLTIGRLNGGDAVFEDSIVRAWGRAASEAQAFTRLRILVCRFPHLVTEQIFTFLDDFPALGLLAVDEYQHPLAFRARAKDHGWPFVPNLGLRVYRYESEAKVSAVCTWQHVYNTCFSDGLFDYKKLSRQCDGVRDIPILDLRSGSANSMPLQNVLSFAETHVFARKSHGTSNITTSSQSIQKRPAHEYSEARSSFPRKRAIRTSRNQYLGNLINDFEM